MFLPQTRPRPSSISHMQKSKRIRGPKRKIGLTIDLNVISDDSIKKISTNSTPTTSSYPTLTNNSFQIQVPKPTNKLNNIDQREIQYPAINKREQLAQFKGVCSPIIDNEIFMGDEIVASNLKLLQQRGITHIINVAAGTITNFFPNHFTYQSIELNDRPTENIYCLFTEIVDFMHTAIKKGGKVFIHCKCGISRSSAVAMCYLMFKFNLDYEGALKYLKAKRSICEPNAGFAFALVDWRQQLNAPLETCRIYSIQPKEEKGLLPKLEVFMDSSLFDSNSCIIVQSPNHLFIWLGGKCDSGALEVAVAFVHRLQKYTKAPKSYQIVQESKEPDMFWNTVVQQSSFLCNQEVSA